MDEESTENRQLEYYKYIAQETGKKYLREVANLSRVIAQLRQAEEALKRYRTLVESSSDAILMLDTNRRMLSFNKAFCDLFGCSPEEIEGKTLRVISKNDEEYTRLEEVIDRLIQEGDTHTLEWEFFRKNGSPVAVETTISSIKHDQEDRSGYAEGGYVAILHDMTKRREREAALRNAEEKYRNIFEHAPEGIFQIAGHGVCLNANPALARIFGFSNPAKLVGNEVCTEEKSFVNREDYHRLKAMLESEGAVEGFESERYRRDGSRIWTSINARTVRDEEGNFVCYEGTTEDITHKKNLESQLRHSQKMEAIGTLAGGVAHDFNNILTALVGYGNLLQLKLEKDDPLRIYVNQILAATEKAVHLTHSLLAFSRKQPVSLKRLGINEIVTDMEKLIQRLLTEDIEVRTNLSNGDVMIMADRTQMEQILLNLTTNARDAMADRRVLTIETRVAQINKEFIKAHGYGKPGRYALLSVSDTGHGMDEQTMEHIFEPFFTTKQVGKGTGLGLSTVYGIVKQHDGYITVESQPGEGTTFRVYIPAVRGRLEETRPVDEKIEGGDETILVAEDDEDIRAMTGQILREYGYSVIAAADGEEAVKKFVEYKDKIKLVIADMIMPKKNGKEVYAEISRKDPSVKVLFVSGYTPDVMIERGMQDSAPGILPKPVSPATLLNKIRTLLDTPATCP